VQSRIDEIMVNHTIKMQPSLIEDTKKKAGNVPVSRIIRTLLEKWLEGEIELEYEKRAKYRRGTEEHSG